jgi:hypothetical protein
MKRYVLVIFAVALLSLTGCTKEKKQADGTVEGITHAD